MARRLAEDRVERLLEVARAIHVGDDAPHDSEQAPLRAGGVGEDAACFAIDRAIVSHILLVIRVAYAQPHGVPSPAEVPVRLREHPVRPGAPQVAVGFAQRRLGSVMGSERAHGRVPTYRCTREVRQVE